MNDDHLIDQALLSDFAQRLLLRSGVPDDKALVIADTLVEGEMLGRETHGIALLAPYLREIDTGGMQVTGEPKVINDIPACLTWDGRKLPGPWLVRRAIEEAIARAKSYGVGTVSVQRSHHAASLGAYLRHATDQGFIIQITLTDPGFSSVAPFGGATPVLTSNPIAFGAPTGDRPIHIDISTSLLTNGMAQKLHSQGRVLDQPWFLDNAGHPSKDPSVITTKPPGTILPLGGLEAGHKGYGIGLMVEVLSGCLSGYGRAELSEGWSASVFIQVIDPAAFGGRAAYLKQIDWLANACRSSTPRDGLEKVSVPGDHSFELREKRAANGIPLTGAIRDALRPWAEKLQVAMPIATGHKSEKK